MGTDSDGKLLLFILFTMLTIFYIWPIAVLLVDLVILYYPYVIAFVVTVVSLYFIGRFVLREFDNLYGFVKEFNNRIRYLDSISEKNRKNIENLQESFASLKDTVDDIKNILEKTPIVQQLKLNEALLLAHEEIQRVRVK